MFLLAGTEQLNLPRFGRKRRFFEVYSLRCHDPRQGVALWYRQGLLVREGAAPEAMLSVMIRERDRDSSEHYLQRSCPLNEARIERDIFYFSVAGGEFYHKGCHGELESDGERVAWQLAWEPSDKPFRPYPFRIFYKPGWPFAKIVTPNPDIKISGPFQWGEKRWHFDQVPGCQTHVWGEHSADNWTWGQVSQFEGDEDISFEAVSGRVRFHRRLLPTITLLRIVVAGNEYRLNRPWHWRNNTSFAHADRWHFEASTALKRFVGDVFVDPKDIIGVSYQDPDGSARYIYRTESAQMKLQIFARQGKEWALERSATSLPTMAYEFASMERVADIPLVA